MAYKMLSEVMIDPSRPNKNKGETCSLAFAKAKNTSSLLASAWKAIRAMFNGDIDALVFWLIMREKVASLIPVSLANSFIFLFPFASISIEDNSFVDHDRL